MNPANDTCWEAVTLQTQHRSPRGIGWPAPPLDHRSALLNLAEQANIETAESCAFGRRRVATLLFDDTRYWHDNETYTPVEIAVRLHHLSALVAFVTT